MVIKKINLGVIGLGVGVGHLRSYQEYSSSKVVAICDKNKDLLKKVSKEYKVSSTFTDIDEMLDASLNLDAVSIALPNYLHAPVTIKALNHGLHVLCEKPMAMNAKEAEDMVSAAKKNKKKLMIDFSYRFIDHNIALKKFIDNDGIGEIYYCYTACHRRCGIPNIGSWFGIKAFSGGGSLIDLGVHRLDLAMWFMNYPKVISVLARTFDFLGKRIASEKRVKFDVEDLAVAFLILENNIILMLEASWDGYFEKKENMVTQILGTKGGIIQKNVNEGYEFEAKICSEIAGCQINSTIFDAKNVTKDAMKYFVDSIVYDKDPIVTAEEGLENMRIIDAIYKSAENNTQINIQR
jgi:predicted dehydrogenase